MIVNKNSVAALDVSFRGIFTDALHGKDHSPLVNRLAIRFPNSAAEVDLSWIADIPGMKELVGDAEIGNFEFVNWAVKNREWHQTIGVKTKHIERDQLGLYEPRFQLLAAAAGRHPDELLAEAMLAGFTTKDYTGKNFFDTGKKHFGSAKASFSNKLEVKLTNETFAQALEMLQTSEIVHSDGSTTALGLGTQPLLIAGPKLRQEVKRVLVAENDENGATNINRGDADFIIWPELGTSTAWFLMDEGYAMKPFAFSDEKPASLLSVTNPEDSHVLIKKEFLFQAYGRYNAGFMLPQLIVGSTGENDPA